VRRCARLQTNNHIAGLIAERRYPQRPWPDVKHPALDRPLVDSVFGALSAQLADLDPITRPLGHVSILADSAQRKARDVQPADLQCS
jgi:hypothetical protein